ncbi:MAG: hypothetical protein JWM76_3748 [Pseudonocardiales bacterium]|nr:hypothetical protein [Pseudonocardiales bacterium]
MFKVMLALHLLFAVFAIGPLVHAATTAGRGVRRGDAIAISGSARMLRIYSYASVLVVIFGFGLMSSKSAYTHQSTAEFGDTYIWLSTLLWAFAVALVLLVIVPGLQKATESLGRQESASALTARVSAAGGVVGLIFAGIVFLMVYRPGS